MSNKKGNPASLQARRTVHHKNMVGEVRIDSGQSEKTTFVIVAAQSVKNTDTAERKGYDTGKKASGIKRHIAVDTQGLPHAIDVTDSAGISVAFSNHRDSFSVVASMLVGGSYTGRPFADAVRNVLELQWKSPGETNCTPMQ